MHPQSILQSVGAAASNRLRQSSVPRVNRMNLKNPMNEKTNETGSASGGVPLPIDERRLKSIASDIARGWTKDLPDIEKRAMMWAIERFHAFLVDGSEHAQQPTGRETPDFVTAEHALNWLESVRPGWGKRVREHYAARPAQPAEPGDTPRTDDARAEFERARWMTGAKVSDGWDFSRTLERENAALSAEVERLTEEIRQSIIFAEAVLRAETGKEES